MDRGALDWTDGASCPELISWFIATQTRLEKAQIVLSCRSEDTTFTSGSDLLLLLCRQASTR
jgi:hypothetical protein